MAKLTKKDVDHVAILSNLNLTDAEKTKFMSQLSKIIDFVGELNKVDTEGIEPTSQTTGLSNVSREDTVKSEDILPIEKAISGTDNSHNSLFKVPAILSERSSE